MADYSCASEINLVPTFYLSASSFEYYDWEDVMEDFLWGRGLEPRMKIFCAKRTFSKQVFKWWINLQQQHIASGDEPCRTWNSLKVMLQCHFDHPLEHPIPKINKDTMTSEKHSRCTKSIVRSSWSDSITGDAGLTPSKQQAIAMNPAVKKVGAGATNLHGPQQ
jgi:hypothetical protein